MHFGKDSISCTLEHPFFVNNSWVEAKELKVGDKLFAYAGKKIAIDSIYAFSTDTATKVYNLEVAGNNDFYVSSAKVLVHNCETKLLPKFTESTNKAINETLSRINCGVKLAHRNDGTIFKNMEGLLPKQAKGYYREFVVPTPGVKGAGLQRLIKGLNGEIFYSPNHYKSFIRVK